MGVCCSQSSAGSHPTPGAKGNASSLPDSTSPGDAQLQRFDKRGNGLTMENNNVATQSKGAGDIIDATGHYHLAATVGIQTDDTDSMTDLTFPTKAPLLNGTAHQSANDTTDLPASMDAGVMNRGFVSSSPSLTKSAGSRSSQRSTTPVLSDRVRRIVQDSWKKIEPQYDLYGAMMFANLAINNPNIAKLFPFGTQGLTYSQLLANPDVRAHGRRVMETLQSVVEDMGDLELVIPLLEDLGGRHNAYRAKKTQIKAVGAALLKMLKDVLAAGYNDEVEAAWLAVFNFVSDTMATKMSDGPLTADQCDLVRRTWAVLSLDPEQHGAAMFSKLVSQNPQLGSLFPFGGLQQSYSQLLRNPDVRAHGKLVMNTIGQAVGTLDNLDLLVPTLRDLARRHIGYNVSRQQFAAVGEALMHAIEEGLGRSFSDEIRNAWLGVFQLVVETMSDILPAKSMIGVSSAQRTLVQTTWKKLVDQPEKHGAVMFAKLVTEHPEVGKLFPFGGKNLTYDQLLRDKDVRAHGKKVMETVGSTVNGLDNLQEFMPVLQDLALRHGAYNVKKSYFQPAAEALMHAVKAGIGSSFTPDVRDAWSAVFKIIVDTICEFLPEEAVLTEAQKRLVQTSWKSLSSDPEMHGAVMFAKLVSDNPEVGHLFPFGGKGLTYNQLLRDKNARAHGKKVMETVGTAVSGLDDLDLLVPILQDLAKRHVGYKVKKRYFQPVGAALMHAIEQGLGRHFTAEHRDAWSSVFKIVVDTMSEFLLDEPILTEAKKHLVQTSWRILYSSPEQHGAVMFAKLVTDHPEVGSLFPFGGKGLSYDQLIHNAEARAHGKKVMETVGTAVSGLDDLSLLVPILQELAKRHVGYKVKKRYFESVGAALMHAIEQGLGRYFTSEIKEAWSTVFKIVVDTMSEFLPEDPVLTDEQKRLVQTSWQALSSDPEQHGSVMFAKLVTENPQLGKLFPFGGKGLTYDQLVKDKNARAHGKKVMETVGTAVSGLDELELLRTVLHDLAKRHIGYNVKRNYFEPVGAALIHSIEQGLGRQFTAQHRDAWSTVFKIVVDTMSEYLPEGPPLTDEQKRLVQTSWKKLASDPEKHGAIMFAKLVTGHPEVGSLFPFGGKGLTYDQLVRDKNARAHGKKVMETVGTAVSGLDDISLLLPILQELAKRHIGYTVKKHHFVPVGEALMHAIKEGLGSSFNPEIRDAWSAVFKLVVDTMSKYLPEGLALSDAQKRLVQASWRRLASDPEQHGAVMFAKLVTSNPSVGSLFPFGGKGLTFNQLVKDKNARAHGKKVMETVGTAVSGLDDPDLLMPILQELAKRHIGYTVKKHHFAPVGEALLYAIGEGLGSQFDARTKEAWIAVFGLVVNTMAGILPA